MDHERVLVAHFGQDHVARADLIDVSLRGARATPADDDPVFVGIVVVRLDSSAGLQSVDTVMDDLAPVGDGPLSPWFGDWHRLHPPGGGSVSHAHDPHA